MVSFVVPPLLAKTVEAEPSPQRLAWLADLPETVGQLAARWELEVGAPFEPGGQTAWVAPVRDRAGRDLVLKVGWRHLEAEHEPDGLRAWRGQGAVLLYDSCRLGLSTALLLERCEPGTPLSAVRPEAEQDLIVAGLLRRLWRAPTAGLPFRPLQAMCRAWVAEFDQRLAALPKAATSSTPGWLARGRSCSSPSPASADREVLLCTDLHAGNVLAARREPWLVIDPKPFVGDPCYDVLQHLLNCARTPGRRPGRPGPADGRPARPRRRPGHAVAVRPLRDRRTGRPGAARRGHRARPRLTRRGQAARPRQRQRSAPALPGPFAYAVSTWDAPESAPLEPQGPANPQPWTGGPVEFDRVVPPSGNMVLVKRQIWLGPARAGLTVRFWADCDLIHLFIGGARVKTLRSHLSVNDLARLTAAGAVPAGPSPLPRPEPVARRRGPIAAVEVERCIARNGRVCLAGQSVPAAEVLAGRLVGIRIEPTTLMFFDLDTRELLRTRPNPLTTGQIRRLRGVARPVRHHGRRPSRSGCSAGPRTVAWSWSSGRRSRSAGSTPTAPSRSRCPRPPWRSSSTTARPAIVRRTTTQAVRSIKAQRPWTATPSVS